jgi:hypothetical protein
MAVTQRALVEKADLVVADLVANGGYLLPEQVRTFLRMIKDEPTILREARRVNMKSHTREVNKIGFTNRILRAAPASGTYMPDSDRAKPTTGKVLLETNKIMAEVHIDYETLEDNIEGGNLEQVIMQEMAKQAALDLEEYVILADKMSGDTYLQLQDGIIKQATVNVENVAGPMSKEQFSIGIKAMPSKYLRNPSAFRWYVSHANETDYRDSLGDRPTAGGDSLIEGFRSVYHHGVPVVPAAMVPGDTGILTRPDNIIWGVWRDIMVETDRDIRSQVFIIVLTMRVGTVLEEAEAVVILKGIGTPAAAKDPLKVEVTNFADMPVAGGGE